jgi:hypothetical protein
MRLFWLGRMSRLHVLVLSLTGLVPLAAPQSAHATPITAFATWQSAAGTTTTIDFESLAPGASVPGNAFAASGLSIVQRDGQPIRAAFLGDGSFVSAANFNSGDQGLTSSAVPGLPFGYDDTKSENYDFAFGHSVFAAGLWVGNLNPGFNTVSVDFLGTGGTLLDTLALNTLNPSLVGSGASFDNRLFVGLISGAAITAIRVHNNAGDLDGVVFDDVSFTAAAPLASVPEPGSLTLLGTGIFGFATRLRRRRRK